MINYNFEIDFQLQNQSKITDWITNVITEEGCTIDCINYIFCNDAYLHKINLEFLQHDTFTDIISFDYSIGKNLQGDIFISIDRVIENANIYSVTFIDELKRVLVHGVLHYCGYKDKTESESVIMRNKENYYIAKADF